MHDLVIAALIGFAALPALARPDASSLRADWRAWHERRVERLTAEDGWLTLIDLAFLEEGETTIGRAEGSDLRYAHIASDHLGRFIRTGNVARFEAAPGASVTADGAPVERMTLVGDDAGTPTVLRSGPVSIILIRRGGAPALRVRDNQSPTRLQFRGVETWEYDESFRIPARIEPAREGETIAVTDVLGNTADQPLAATLVCTIDGREVRLDATEGGPDSYFIVFGDATNGDGSHGGGRFIYVPTGENGATVIDFNYAYNPPCAFTDYSTCPLPTQNNRLPMPIEAGEKAPAGH